MTAIEKAREALDYLRRTAAGNDYVNDYELRRAVEAVEFILDDYSGVTAETAGQAPSPDPKERP